jgi:hypothetical protein
MPGAKMTREEQELYSLTLFRIGDLVEIDESDIVGAIEGMQIKIGCEDQYLIAYHDNCGNPQRVWWPASSLEAVGDNEPPMSNVIPFPRNATFH